MMFGKLELEYSELNENNLHFMFWKSKTSQYICRRFERKAKRYGRRG